MLLGLHCQQDFPHIFQLLKIQNDLLRCGYSPAARPAATDQGSGDAWFEDLGSFLPAACKTQKQSSCRN